MQPGLACKCKCTPVGKGSVEVAIFTYMSFTNVHWCVRLNEWLSNCSDNLARKDNFGWRMKIYVYQVYFQKKPDWTLFYYLDHCALIRWVIVIQPGLKYELFHYTMVPFDHILSKVQIFNYCRFYFYAQCWILSIITSFAWLFSCYHGSIWNIFGSW